MQSPSEEYEIAIQLEALANELGWDVKRRSFRGKTIALYLAKKPEAEPGGEHEDAA